MSLSWYRLTSWQLTFVSQDSTSTGYYITCPSWHNASTRNHAYQVTHIPAQSLIALLMRKVELPCLTVIITYICNRGYPCIYRTLPFHCFICLCTTINYHYNRTYLLLFLYFVFCMIIHLLTIRLNMDEMYDR